jgi:alpha-1,3-mannosyl-glycoprotein beta-1,2-N-acetylglucosaminyltransferase
VQPHELVKKSVAHVPQLSPVDLPKFMSPLIIFTCKRDNYLNQTMKEVLDYLPQTCEIGCPIIISQDGNDENVAKVVKMYQDRYQDVIPIFHLQHEQQQAQPISTGQLKGRLPPGFAYKALALHYGWGLQHAFDGMKGYPKPDRLIVLEEDLHISPDFFDYFAHMAPILDQDDTLLAVSAFNDNGKVGKVKDETRVLRSDFFPGLGWILTRKLWDTELSSKWPGGYWDDWLREPAQRQGRHILRPEVSIEFLLLFYYMIFVLIVIQDFKDLSLWRQGWCEQ